MYRIVDVENEPENIVGLKVEGILTAEDYETLIPYFENLINQCGQASLLCDMSYFGGVEVQAFWKDFTFSIRHLPDFKRLAVVGDQRWLEWETHLVNPLLKTEIKCFLLDKKDNAWQWLKVG